MIFLIIFITAIVLGALHASKQSDEWNAQNLKKATDAAKYAALGTAVGIAAALKDEPGRRG